MGEHRAVAGHAGGQHAVEHVHAPQHALDQAVRRTHAHQIARLMLRHEGHHLVQHLVHDLLGLAHGESADAEAGQIQLRHLLGALDAQIGVERALHDAEQRLILPRLGLHAALQPAQRAVHRVPGAIVVAGIGRTFVKLHGDVRAQRLLNLHGDLRRDEALAAVQVGAELHALVVQLAQIRQRKHLESAAVGEDRAIPVHEGMQSARLLHQLLARAQVQVVGVGQDDLRAAVLQLVGRHGLDAGLGAHGHEDGRFDHAVGRVQPAATRARLLANVQQFKFKGSFHFRLSTSESICAFTSASIQSQKNSDLRKRITILSAIRPRLFRKIMPSFCGAASGPVPSPLRRRPPPLRPPAWKRRRTGAHPDRSRGH